jgi:metal-responsive CopG/Arc/MetJ family transcriptional regulator
MRTAISLPDRLFERADALARHLSVLRSELHARALGRFVAEHDESEPRAALDAVYAAKPSELPPGAASAQATWGDLVG